MPLTLLGSSQNPTIVRLGHHKHLVNQTQWDRVGFAIPSSSDDLSSCATACCTNIRVEVNEFWVAPPTGSTRCSAWQKFVANTADWAGFADSADY